MIQELISIGQQILLVLLFFFAALGFGVFWMTTFGEYSVRYVGDDRREFEEGTRRIQAKAQRARAKEARKFWENEEREEEERLRASVTRQPSFPDFPKS